MLIRQVIFFFHLFRFRLRLYIYTRALPVRVVNEFSRVSYKALYVHVYNIILYYAFGTRHEPPAEPAVATTAAATVRRNDYYS